MQYVMDILHIELENLLPKECYIENGFIQFDCLVFIYPPSWYSE